MLRAGTNADARAANTDTYSYANADANTYADPNPDSHAHSDTYPNADIDAGAANFHPGPANRRARTRGTAAI